MTGRGEARPLYAVDLMLAKTLGLDKNILVNKYDEDVPARLCRKIMSMARRRAMGEPLSYILGEAEFYGRPFFVGEGVLIPRPETELLVEEMLRCVPGGAIFADWCTGSGCIGLTILMETRNTKCVGVDCSPEALAWARKNAMKYSLSDRFTPLLNAEPRQAGFSEGFFDCIIANPPYIPSAEISGLMRDVKDYEPLVALDGGEGGIELYKKFFALFPYILKPGGYLGLETAGGAQSAILLKTAPDSLAPERQIHDYNGILRHLIWRRRPVE